MCMYFSVLKMAIGIPGIRLICDRDLKNIKPAKHNQREIAAP